MIEKNYDEGIILQATYERNTDGEFQVKLVLKIYNTFGIANMYFKDENIDALFDNYSLISPRTQSLQKMIHKEVYTPTASLTKVPEGISFVLPFSSEFKGFVENNNHNGKRW